MDIYCPRCGEPWEIDSLHELIEEQIAVIGPISNEEYEDRFNQKRKEFRSVGCNVFNTKHNVPANRNVAAISQVAFDLMGDDIDGIASMMDDAEAMGLFE